MTSELAHRYRTAALDPATPARDRARYAALADTHRQQRHWTPLHPHGRKRRRHRGSD